MGQQLVLIVLVLLMAVSCGVFIGRRLKPSTAVSVNERLFQQIVEAAPVGICIIKDRKFAFVNETYYRMFGYESPREVIGRYVEELYAEEERDNQRKLARQRVAGEPVPTIYETIGLKKSGEKFEVSARVSLITYQNQLSSLGFVIDRSVETEMRRRLDQANRLEAVGTLAGGIAHDFNNILSAIIGYSELALLRCSDDLSISTDLRQVLKAGERAKDLIRQILLFSRKQDKLMQIVRLSTVVDDVMRMVRATLPTTIAIDLRLLSEVKILADATCIHQLIMNLCANAEHAMRGGDGTLSIEVIDYKANEDSEKEYPGLSPGDYVLLQVGDTGKGIPASIQEKILEPFFTTKEVGDGTGMGLSQVHTITTSHQAYLTFADNKPTGTVFSVFFPAVLGDEEAGILVENALGNAKGTILLVDDEEMVLEVTCRTLSELGYEVVACDSSKKAYALFEQNPHKFNLVVSDMTMPNITGDKLATMVMEVMPSLPVILCSGYSAAIEQNPDIKKRVTVLEKPIAKSTLAETVALLLNVDQ